MFQDVSNFTIRLLTAKAADRIKKAEAEAGTREKEGLETWRCQWNNGNVGNEDKTWSMWFLNSIQIILHSKSD